MINKKIYSIYRVNQFLHYYKVKNKIPLKYLYSKLYFKVKN